MTSAPPTVERAQIESLAYLALARRLASPEGWGEGRDLVASLAECGWHEAAALAARADDAACEAPERLARDISRVCHRSLPPPYETTYTSRGSTLDLADIAGFYRAFGVNIEGEKPDHVVAELEYLSFIALRQAHASGAGEAEHAETCARARAGFIRDHAGCWLDAFADRIDGETGADGAYALMVRAAARAIAADARTLGVEPRPAPAAMAEGAMPGPTVDLERPPCEVDDD
jgi:hypothetical protein